MHSGTRDRLIARAGADVVGEGLEDNGIDGVDVAAQGAPAFGALHVPEFRRVVHGARCHKVAAAHIHVRMIICM